MQHTSNYNLPQWEATDPIKRADFNSAMSAIDTAIKAASDAAGGAPKFCFGSYTGTGTFGASNRNSITFNFTPKFIAFLDGIPNAYWFNNALPSAVLLFWNKTTEFWYGHQSYGKNLLTYNGNTISWYNDYNTTCQRNNENQLYYYFAVG